MNPKLVEFKEYLSELLDEYDFMASQIIRYEYGEGAYGFLHVGGYYDASILLFSDSIKYFVETTNYKTSRGEVFIKDKDDIRREIKGIIEEIKKKEQDIMEPELNKFKEYLEDLLDERGFSPEATVMGESETCYILLNPGNYDSYIAIDPETVYYQIQMGNSGLYKEFSYENENDILANINGIIETIKRADKRPK